MESPSTEQPLTPDERREIEIAEKDELFADEGQATFRLGLRRIQATSHFIPTEQGRRMVIIMPKTSRNR